MKSLFPKRGHITKFQVWEALKQNGFVAKPANSTAETFFCEEKVCGKVLEAEFKFSGTEKDGYAIPHTRLELWEAMARSAAKRADGTMGPVPDTKRRCMICLYRTYRNLHHQKYGKYPDEDVPNNFSNTMEKPPAVTVSYVGKGSVEYFSGSKSTSNNPEGRLFFQTVQKELEKRFDEHTVTNTKYTVQVLESFLRRHNISNTIAFVFVRPHLGGPQTPWHYCGYDHVGGGLEMTNDFESVPGETWKNGRILYVKVSLFGGNNYKINGFQYASQDLFHVKDNETANNYYFIKHHNDPLDFPTAGTCIERLTEQLKPYEYHFGLGSRTLALKAVDLAEEHNNPKDMLVVMRDEETSAPIFSFVPMDKVTTIDSDWYKAEHKFRYKGVPLLLKDLELSKDGGVRVVSRLVTPVKIRKSNNIIYVVCMLPFENFDAVMNLEQVSAQNTLDKLFYRASVPGGIDTTVLISYYAVVASKDPENAYIVIIPDHFPLKVKGHDFIRKKELYNALIYKIVEVKKGSFLTCVNSHGDSLAITGTQIKRGKTLMSAKNTASVTENKIRMDFYFLEKQDATTFLDNFEFKPKTMIPTSKSTSKKTVPEKLIYLDPVMSALNANLPDHPWIPFVKASGEKDYSWGREGLPEDLRKDEVMTIVMPSPTSFKNVLKKVGEDKFNVDLIRRVVNSDVEFIVQCSIGKANRDVDMVGGLFESIYFDMNTKKFATFKVERLGQVTKIDGVKVVEVHNLKTSIGPLKVIIIAGMLSLPDLTASVMK